MTVRVAPLTGEALTRVLPALARLRITVFRDWPYLYDGTLAYEQSYIDKFAKSDGAVIVAAFDGEDIVGAATASPMRGQTDAFAAPFQQHGYEVDHIFYFGESVLLATYRGRGIGHAFFEHREAHARQTGTFAHAAFCSVVRPNDHPKRPKNYVPLDAFWSKRGYTKMDGIVGAFSWRDIGDAEATQKPMQYWMKAL